MNAGHPAPGSPVGSSLVHYKLDDMYGDTAQDSGTLGYDGNLAGASSCPGAAACPSWTTDGKFAGALDFDGTDDYMYFEGIDGSPLDIIGDVSVSLWLNVDTVGDAENIIYSGEWGNEAEEGNETYFLRWDTTSGNDIEYGHEYGASSLDEYNVFDTNLSADTWYHVVAVRDVSENTVKLYIDGVQTGGTFTYANDPTGGANGEKAIGSNDDGSLDYFDGTIDEVKIYNFALTAGQIKAEYNQGSAQVFGATSTDSSNNPTWSSLDAYCPPGQGSSCTAPILEWLFDESSGSSANDTSGNSNTGTITSAIWTPHGYDSSWALNFDGSSAYVEDSTTPISAYPFTLSAWAKTTATSDTITILGLHDINDTDRYQLIWINCNASCIAEAISRENVSSPVIAAGTTNLGDGNWHHVVGTFANSSDRKIYVDGVQEGTNRNTEAFDAAIDNATAGVRRGSTLSKYFDGEIDQVRIYNYARTPAQIVWEFNQGAPFGWWKLDDGVTGDSQTVYDSGSGGNNGSTVDGGGTALDCTVTGKRNTACSFDNVNDAITTVDQDFATGDFTVTGWFKSSNGSDAGSIISKFAATVDNGRVIINNGNIEAWVDDDVAGNDVVIDSSQNWADGNWHHYAFVVSSSDLELYLDGISRGTDTHDGSLDTNNATWTIGADNDGAAGFFDGQIDEVKLFTYAMTDEQVRNDYNAGAVRFGE
jgi:hypothetical protein